MTSTRPATHTLPVTPSQLGMLIYAAADPRSAYYGIANGFLVEDGITADAMAAAWRVTVGEFAALRGSFEYGSDERWRMVIASAPGEDQVTTRPWHRPPTDVELREVVRQHAAAAAAPERLSTIEIIDAGRTYVIWAHHHASLDGWSKAIILDRVRRHARRFAGLTVTPPEPVTDDLEAVQAQLIEAAGDRSLDEFWRSRLAGAPAALLGAATTAAADPHDLDVPIDPRTWQGASATARRQGATVPSVFAAAFAAVLAACLRQQDVTFGVVTSLRGVVDAADERAVGLCLNTLPCRVRLDLNESWVELLPRLHAELGEAWQHGAVDPTALSRAAGRPLTQLVDTLLVFQNYPGAIARFTGIDEERPTGLRMICARDVTNYALTVSVYPTTPGRWGMRLTFDAARVPAATAAGFVKCLLDVLAGLAAGPDRPVGDTPLAGPEPAHQVPATKAPDVLTAFDRVRQATPDAPAVACARWQLSYVELDERATGLAMALRAVGVRVGSAVGLLVDHHAETAIAALATLRLGASYVPLDPQWSAVHLRGLTARLPLAAVVTVGDTVALADDLAVPAVRADLPHDGTGFAATGEPPPALPAVVLHTSGTTGEAKGVTLTRGGVAAMVAVTSDEIPGPVRTVRFTRLGFDLSTLDIWLPLTSGGCCVFPRLRTPPPDVFAEYVHAYRPDLVVLPPGYFNICVDERPELLRDLRHVMVGGEPPSARHAAIAERHRPGLRITNIYGPTEATTYVTRGRVDPSPREGGSDIGHPLASVRMIAVDPWLRPLPAGLPGELCVAGPHVALGYLHDGASTAAAFVPEPGGRPGARMYRTGDLGYLEQDGRYRLLGRIDRQVKIRGLRVEPAGIEALLRKDSRVRDAAVIARGGTGAMVVAFVVPHERDVDSGELDAALRENLRSALPEYLHPDRILIRATLPYTPNGKVDSAILWSDACAPAPAETNGEITVSGPVAAAVAQVWQDVLSRPFALDEDFFMVGGNSLLAMRLVMRLDRAFGIRLPMRTVLDSSSGRDLVRRAEDLAVRVKERER